MKIKQNKKILIILFLIISITFLTAMTVYTHTATIKNNGTGRYKSVLLNRGVLSNSNYDLSDIRITDEKNNNIPFFINEFDKSLVQNNNLYPMEQIDSFIKEDNQIFDFAMSNIPNHDIEATSLEFFIDDSDYIKNITILGGYDGISWKEVIKSKIYSVDSYKTTNVIFKKTEKYTHYRIICDDKNNPININTASLIFDVLYTENNYFLMHESPVIYDIHEVADKKQTAITINNIKNLDIKSINIESSDMFSRTVNINTHHTRYEIYNLKFKNLIYKNTLMEFEAEKLATENVDEITIYIDNGDNNPINISSVGLEYFSKELIFEDTGSSEYYINFDGNKDTSPPSYDIQKYKDRILENETIDSLTIDNIHFSEKMPPEDNEKQDEINKIILNIVIIIVAIVLLFIIIISIVKNSNGKKENDPII